ncbi:MAG: PLP-dependent aminotransferase family protein, partial [Planctomycetaceae bacterium]
RELRYDGPDLPSIWSRDESQAWVILAQTFSKSFSPGLRVGFGVLPADLVQPVLDRKGNEDFGSPHLNQQLLTAVLEGGLYREHVELLRGAYRRKRDAMLQAADRYFQDLNGVEWVRPLGGLYVWVTVPDGIETGFNSHLFQQATQVEKVMYVPGELCFATSDGKRPNHHLRLSFGAQTPDGIDEGMQRLARALRHVL